MIACVNDESCVGVIRARRPQSPLSISPLPSSHASVASFTNPVFEVPPLQGTWPNWRDPRGGSLQGES